MRKVRINQFVDTENIFLKKPTTIKLLFEGRKAQQFKEDLPGSWNTRRQIPDSALHKRKVPSREQLKSHSFPSDQ